MIEAHLTLRSVDAAPVGRDRIRLLEAVAREGSITAGARAAGLSYKAAWDALDAMARLFGQPLLDKRTGGRTGGGARLTPAGAHVIAAFGRLEADLSRAAHRFDPTRAAEAPPVLRTSARNAFRGHIAAIRPLRLTADVVLALPEGGAIVARVTDASLRGLDLAVGRPAIALVKAPFVRLAPDEGSGPGSENAFVGTVLTVAVAGRAAEVVLDIGAGRTLAATPTARKTRLLGLAPGRNVRALLDATDVILAID